MLADEIGLNIRKWMEEWFGHDFIFEVNWKMVVLFKELERKRLSAASYSSI